jgi:hypothetical protein
MGNCVYSYGVSDKLTEQFVDFNIIDKEYNIIIGIYKNPNTNTTIKYDNGFEHKFIQGICVGKLNNKISKIKFGIFHQCENNILELFFEDFIKLVLIKVGVQTKLTLNHNDLVIEKYINTEIIKNIKLINNDSEYIDLILKII